MRDQRDPTEMYNQIVNLKTVAGVSITEAADMVEAVRQGLDSRASGPIPGLPAITRVGTSPSYDPAENGVGTGLKAPRDG